MRAIIVAALAVAVVALGACGESKQDKAQNRVCDARANISKQVDTLKGLTPSTATTDQIQSSLQSIGDSLKTIGEAQSDLNADRRKEIQAANQQFTAQLQDIGSTVLRSTSLSEAESRLKAAVDKLSQSYETTLATVDCG